MDDRDTGFGAFLIGFLVGGLVGAAVSLLFAPQSGEETRAYIRDKSIELKDKASESIEDARQRTEQALEEARLRSDAAFNELRARTEELAKLTKREKVTLEEQVVEESAETGKGKKAEAGA